MGSTPVVRLNRLAPEGGAQILVKFEGLNVGGSIKSRTAYNMLCEAEKAGRVRVATAEPSLKQFSMN